MDKKRSFEEFSSDNLQADPTQSNLQGGDPDIYGNFTPQEPFTHPELVESTVEQGLDKGEKAQAPLTKPSISRQNVRYQIGSSQSRAASINGIKSKRAKYAKITAERRPRLPCS